MDDTTPTAKPLAGRVRSGVAWNVASVASSHLVWVVRSVIVARLLAPSDFGLFGMAVTVLAALTALTSVGLELSVIVRQFKDDEEMSAHLNTVWTAGLARGVCVTLILLAAAYPASRFYGDPRLFGVLVALSPLPLVQALQNIGLVVLRKRIEFGRVALFEQTHNLVSTAIAVALALLLGDVRAIVLGQLAGAAAGVALSYVFHPYRPRLMFDREAFREAYGFAKYTFVIYLMSYVTTAADNVVVGRLYGAGALGLYILAYTMATLPVAVVGGALGGGTFPAYVEMSAKEPARLEGAFARVFGVASATLVLLAVPLAVAADEIVVLLYGVKWAAAGPVLRVLATVGFLRGMLQVISPLLVSVRGLRPDAFSKTFEAVLFLVLLYPLTARYGLLGAAWAAVVVYVCTIAGRFRMIKLTAPGAFRPCLRSLAASTLAALAGLSVGALALGATSSPPARLFTGGLSAFLTTLAVVLLVTPELRRTLLDNLPRARRR
ncbi:MAG TPA: oligosaccharide flippase family protein [Pyrinomonadaceae bacterium]|nr:oligosaccharide flippase family protein [Pyrinomonadaceae bacterium]